MEFLFKGIDLLMYGFRYFYDFAGAHGAWAFRRRPKAQPNVFFTELLPNVFAGSH